MAYGWHLLRPILFVALTNLPISIHAIEQNKTARAHNSISGKEAISERNRREGERANEPRVHVMK